MTIIVKSRQIYDTHEEELCETYQDGQMDNNTEVLSIVHEKGSMLINKKNEEIELSTHSNTIQIKINEKKVLTYQTPYGKIEMETYGEELEIDEENGKIHFVYQVKLNDSISYKNIVEITKE